MLFKSQMHSYRELPIRYAEFATLYRYEKAGTLTGLARVRSLTQDDCHIFCTPEQVHTEFGRALEISMEVLHTYGLDKDFTLRLSLHDPNVKDYYIGSEEVWQKAEADLAAVLDARGLKYTPVPGEAAFYGPKMDLIIRDALGREWQCSTIQLDFNQPNNFELEYIGEDGQAHRPVMLHHAVTGSTERFLAMLIEHYAGNFPVWLAPVQAMMIPIADRHLAYAEAVAAKLKAADLRVEIDSRSERMNAKVRDAQLQKIPYMLVVGDREASEEAVSLRLRSNENLGAIPLARFMEEALTLSRERSLELWPGKSE